MANSITWHSWDQSHDRGWIPCWKWIPRICDLSNIATLSAVKYKISKKCGSAVMHSHNYSCWMDWASTALFHSVGSSKGFSTLFTFTHTCTHWWQKLPCKVLACSTGAIWGLAYCSRIFQCAARGTQESNQQLSDYWRIHSTSWATALRSGIFNNLRIWFTLPLNIIIFYIYIYYYNINIK